jgi:signal transduction histidine kinase/DNA-binding response OmpR family regulator
MRPRAQLRKPAIVTRRLSSFIVRAAIVTFMSFAVAFGFLAGATSPAAHYDPYMFAIGVASLFGAACGAMGILIARIRQMRAELRDLETRLDEAADRNWEIREAQERAASFLEAQDDLIVRRDVEGAITYVNDAFCALAARDRAELVATTFSPPVLEQGETSVMADGARGYDQKIATGDGARWIAWREVTVRTDGASEMQSVGRDVTDRVLTEHALAVARDQAEAANRAKSRFLAMVSHEIRTPLNGILGIAELLGDTPLTAEQTTYLKAMKTSGETLLSLIEEVLDFSKIEAGRLELAVRPFALAAFVEETVELLGPRAQEKGLEIGCYVDERLPARVIGDAARLRQVLFNLAGNAIKFTETGGVSIVVEPTGQPDRLSIAVSDTGIGISLRDQARIFLEFEQADGTASRKYDGTGLGLTISNRIAESMGGSISVESTPGQGSTFRLVVPLPGVDESSADGVGLPQSGVADLSGSDILIVAPTATEASLIARRLQRWGAYSKIVPDEKVAAATLPERTWSALLIDHRLGTQACKALARATANVPQRIVLVTPAMRGELPALKEAGFTGYLIKPVRTASLAARLSANDGFDSSSPGEIAERPGAPPSSGGLSVLVAEDNEINALLTRALLLKLGHHPTVAANGAAAIDCWLAARAGDAPYDRILMDLHMPGMDGLEATRCIRANEAASGAARTPIVALTANASIEDREACLAAGMDGFLLKPLDRERLALALARAAEAALAA